MLASDKHRLRAIAIKQRLREIESVDELTDEIRGESAALQGELNDVETREAAAVASEPDKAGTIDTGGDSETRERREIRARTGLGEYLAAAVGGVAVTGAGAEYAAACNVPAVGHIPMALFRDRRPGAEERAITSGPAVDGPVQPVVPFVFERSAAASLGILMPMVPAGQVQIPKVTTSPPASVLAKDAAAASTAAAVSLDSQAPKRIAGQFELRVEDLAVWPMLEDALSEAMQGRVADQLDEQVFNGTSSQLNGLFTQAAAVTAATAVETYTTGIARFAALVDGKHAYSLADVRAVIGSDTFALYAGTFANTNKGDVSLFDYLQMKLGSIRVSDRVPNKASNAQKGIALLTAGPTPPRMFVWDAMQIVRDPFSGAGAGKVTLTATALVSELYIPHGQTQAKEIHPKLS